MSTREERAEFRREVLRSLRELSRRGLYLELRCRFRSPVNGVRCERWLHVGDEHR
jgi:hypothetical protein